MSLGPTKVPCMSTELLPSLLLKGAFKAFSTSKAADSCRLILTAPFGGFWVCKQSAMCAPFTGQSDWQKLGNNLWLNCPSLWTKSSLSSRLEVTSIRALLCPVLPSDKELEFSVRCYCSHKTIFLPLRQDKCTRVVILETPIIPQKWSPFILFRVKNNFLLDDSYQLSYSCWEEKKKKKNNRKKSPWQLYKGRLYRRPSNTEIQPPLLLTMIETSVFTSHWPRH